jgi:hypothetical protein
MSSRSTIEAPYASVPNVSQIISSSLSRLSLLVVPALESIKPRMFSKLHRPRPKGKIPASPYLTIPVGLPVPRLIKKFISEVSKVKHQGKCAGEERWEFWEILFRLGRNRGANDDARIIQPGTRLFKEGDCLIGAQLLRAIPRQCELPTQVSQAYHDVVDNPTHLVRSFTVCVCRYAESGGWATNTSRAVIYIYI